MPSHTPPVPNRTPARPNALALGAILAVAASLLPVSASAQVGVWHPGGGRAIVARRAPVPQQVSPPRSVREVLRDQLAARRVTNLARFSAYAAAGEFPRNHEQPGMLNVFIDDEGHICAAANLMSIDGLLSRVQQVAAQNNFLRLADVHDGPLLAWMLSSGFTQDEIAMIQEPYFFIEPDLPDEPVMEDLEKARLQARFRQIEVTLRRATETSLNQAVDRLIAWRAAHSIPTAGRVLAQGDLFGAAQQVAVVPTPVAVEPVHLEPVPVRPTQPVVYQPRAPGVLLVRTLASNTNVRNPLVWAPGMPLPR